MRIDTFKEELRTRGLLPDEVEDAVYAQCALFDEAALRPDGIDVAGDQREFFFLKTRPASPGKAR